MHPLLVGGMTVLIRTVGRLSTGIDMSYKYGFISGTMLEYVYENKAHGILGIGALLDRVYLNNIGWRAVRQRKDNLRAVIVDILNQDTSSGAHTVILDIASGPARYLREALAIVERADAHAICQDIDKRWLIQGRALAAAAGIARMRFEKGDAFNKELLLAVRPQPTVVVSSGFYDWITDDDLVKKSLEYCYAVLPAGGRVVFTNQCGHRQMELVSQAFVDFNKEPLRMKTRTVAQMETWARDVGFKNLETIVDQWGLYSVTKGEK